MKDLCVDISPSNLNLAEERGVECAENLILLEILKINLFSLIPTKPT